MIIRWHWRAAVAEERGSIATADEYEFRLIHRHVEADPDKFPYVAGHRLMLEWRNLFYPEGLRDGEAEKFVTEEFRRNAAVVRAAGVAGTPFWTQPIAAGLTVTVALAAPEQRFGDNMDDDNAFRVSYTHGDQQWFLARVGPGNGDLSRVAATKLSV